MGSYQTGKEIDYVYKKLICFFLQGKRKPFFVQFAVILAIHFYVLVSRPDRALFYLCRISGRWAPLCLMAIVAGLKAVGVFDILAQKLLHGTSGTVGVIRLLVLLCFFLSMVITNDVALITFVPLALIIVLNCQRNWAITGFLEIAALQTIRC